MPKRSSRRALALVACSLLSVVTAACGDSSGGDNAADTSTTVAPSPQPGSPERAAPATTEPARTIEVAFSTGQVTGGSRRETVKVGERVRIRAVSDVAEELHVHTYDQRVVLQPGQPGEVVFTANIPGRHEVEFEKSGKQALTLEVG